MFDFLHINPFSKEFNPKRKDGSKFFTFIADPFPEGQQKQLLHHLEIMCEICSIWSDISFQLRGFHSIQDPVVQN